MSHSLAAVSRLVFLFAAALGAEPLREQLPPGAMARLGSSRLRHSAAVTALAFSPDGRSLYAGAKEKVVRVWDIATGLEVRRFTQDAPVSGFSLAADGKTLATGNGSRVIQLWDTATGKERRIDTEHLHFHLALSPDGRTLYSGGGPLNEQLCRLDVVTGKPLLSLVKFKEHWSRAVAVSPDGQSLAAAEVNTVSVWSLATGRRLFSVPTEELGGVAGLAFSADGRRLAGAAGPAVIVWDAVRGKELHHFRPQANWAHAVAFSPDGAAVAAGFADRSVRVWDMATGKEVHCLKGHTGEVYAVAFAPDGRTLATGGGDQRVRLWDVRTGRERFAASGPEGTLRVIAFAPDGRTVATAGEEDGIRLWDPAGGTERRRLAGHARALAFSPDGRFLASAGRDVVRLWDPRTGRELLQGAHAAVVTDISFSPDSRTLAASSADGVILLRTVPTEAKVGPVNWKASKRLENAEGGFIGRIIFTPSGRALLVLAVSAPFSTWDLNGDKPRTFREDERGFPWPVQLTLGADGRTLVSILADRRPARDGSGDAAPGQVLCWDLRTKMDRQALVQEKGKEVSIVDGALAHDGRSVATIGADGVLRLWELATGQQRRQWSSTCDGGVTALAFGPDSRTLAVAGAEHTVLLWDTLPAPRQRGLDECWSDLRGADSSSAFQAIARLARSPAESVSFLAERLRPVPPVPAERVRRWIADLDARDFATRRKAEMELEQTGLVAESLLREALELKPSLEVRKRLEQLLALLERPEFTPERLQAARSLEALERAGSPAAVRLLRALAGGAPSAWLTREARASLRRLGPTSVNSTE